MGRRILFILVLCWSLPLLGAPKVVVSVAPLHSLVAGVMEGVAEPHLLIPAGASPHAYSLKPSDARALGDANLIIWVGESLEAVLEKPLHSLSGEATIMALGDAPWLQRLPSREGGVWQDQDEQHSEHGEGHGHAGMDTHLWLSPQNARIIVKEVAARLGQLDGANADRYRRNAEGLVQRIDELEGRIAARLSPLRDRPYIVFHDAYHYFEDAFGLHPVGAISVSPERRPGARRLIAIREAIRERGAVCVFSEPQFRPATVETVLEGTGAKAGVLDPLGAALAPGKLQWFELMQGLADGLQQCLDDAS